MRGGPPLGSRIRCAMLRHRSGVCLQPWVSDDAGVGVRWLRADLWEGERTWGKSAPARSLARRVYQWAERRRCSTYRARRRAALGGVGVWSKDLRPHRWVGWQTPFGCAGLCCQQLGPSSVGLPRIAVHVRHRRTRKRPRASQSGRRRQGRRCGRRQHRAAVHQERDSWTRSTSTWCPSCSGAASRCSTTSALGRSTWSARG
jgi:hypothetical protein